MSTITWSVSGRSFERGDDMLKWLVLSYYQWNFRCVPRLLALTDRRKSLVFRPRIVGARADNFAVFALLDHVGAPPRYARHHKKRGKKQGRHAHQVVRNGRKPVQVRKHPLFVPQ